MKLPSADSPTSPLLWFAVLGAPGAWAGQFAVVYWVTQAQCSATPGADDVALEAWVVVATAIAAAVALSAGLTAIGLFRATSGSEDEDAPPGGRIHFLSVVGMAVMPLFLAIILMNGVGSLVIFDCGA